MCVCIYIYIYMHTYAHFSCTFMQVKQDFMLAFMMGTHERLGMASPVMMMDPLLAASVCQIIINNQWSVASIHIYIYNTHTHTYI